MVGRVQRRIADFADQLFEGGLLLLEGGLRHDQIPLAGGDLRFGGDHVETGHGADLKLLLAVGEEFLGCLQRFLRHAHVTLRRGEIPIGVFQLRHAGDDLQAEDLAGGALVGAGHQHEALVGQTAGAVRAAAG